MEKKVVPSRRFKKMSLYEFMMKQHPRDGISHFNVFERPYDHLTYADSVRREMHDITVLDAQASDNLNTTHKCGPFDFYTIHYEGYVGNSDKKVYDSRLNGIG
jgi:hypothetical protein